MVSKNEFQVTFDSGLNNIESFSLSSFITRNSIDSGESSESKFLIKGSGVPFPFLKEILTYSDTESGFVEIVDTKNTSYFLWGPEKMGKCVNEVAKSEISTYKAKDKYKTVKIELIEPKFDESSYLDICFEGYLPRLRDNEGTCSYFGGPNDTGIDVTLRKQFYEEYIGGTYDSSVFKRKEFSDMFNEWMNERRSSWEGTGLECGYARELDTKNDYFCAMRWHDKETEKYNVGEKPGSKDWWRRQKIKVSANNISVIVAPVDWGPNVTTGRVIDLSHRAMEEINATTDVTWVEMCIVDSDTPLGLVTNQQDNKKIKKL